MFLFTLKKAFFDYWDNFLKMFLLNMGFVLVLGICTGLIFLVAAIPFPNTIFNVFLIVFLAAPIFFIYNGTVHGVVRDVADYKEFTFKSFINHFKTSWLNSFLFSMLFSVLFFLIYFVLEFYGTYKIPFADIAIVLMLCYTFTLIGASQYFFPIYNGLDKKFLKILKKMYLIFVDNPGFSMLLLGFNLLFFILSFITCFIFPGFSFLALFVNTGFKLRMYKYDFLEANPNHTGKIPWDVLLMEDDKKVGKRTLRGLIFPWKD